MQPTVLIYVPGLIALLAFVALWQFLRSRRQGGTIRVRLLSTFVLIVLLPTTVIIAVSITGGLSSGQQQVINQLESIATLKEAEIGIWLQNLQLDLQVELSRDTAKQIITLFQAPPDTAEFQAAYTERLARFLQTLELRHNFEELLLMNLNGQVVLSTNPLQVGKRFNKQDYFIEGLKQEYVSPPFYDLPLGKMSVIAVCPVRDDQGQVWGVVAGRASTSVLNEIMSRRAGLGDSGETYLIGQNHALLTATRFGANDAFVRTQGTNVAIEKHVNGFGLYTGYHGRPVIGVYHWLPQFQVALLAEQEQSEAFRSTYIELQFNIGVALVSVLLAVVAALLITHSIAAPLASLAETASQIAAGDLSRTATMEQQDEVGAMAQAFNSMTAQLRDLIGHLEQRVAERTAELTRRVEQLDLINRVGRNATSLLNLDDLLSHTASLIRNTFGYYAVEIYLVDKEANEIHLSTTTADETVDIPTRQLRLPIDHQSLTGYVAFTGKPLVTDDVSAEPRFRYDKGLPLTRSELVLPLRIGDEVLGVLDLESIELNAFSPQDVQVLQTLADQIAIAIHNARLYQAEAKARHTADILRQVEHVIGSTLDLDELLARILSSLSAVLSYDSAAIMLLKGDSLYIQAERGFVNADTVHGFRLALAEYTLNRQVIETGQPMIIGDVQTNSHWRKNETPGSKSICSWMGIPLIAGGRAIGMLTVDSYQPGAFSQEDARVVSTFAARAAIALENANLYSEVARFNEQLELMVLQRTEELKKAYQTLEKMDKAKSDFIDVAAHELRTPLTLIRGYTQLLGPVVERDQEVSLLVKGILAGEDRLYEIVNSLLDVSKISSQVMKVSRKPTRLVSIIRYVHNKFKPALKERQLALTTIGLDDLPIIQADPVLLKKVFHQLITNAIKYTPDGGSITVAGKLIDVIKDNLVVEIIVSDTGIGIDPTDQELIFEKFYQIGKASFHSSGQTKFKGGGPGLGLSIAKGIVLAHRGKIWVESTGYDEQRCPGSHFHVCLPVR